MYQLIAEQKRIGNKNGVSGIQRFKLTCGMGFLNYKLLRDVK